MTWECTPELFNWFYAEDETVYIISGEVFIKRRTALNVGSVKATSRSFLAAVPAHGG